MKTKEEVRQFLNSLQWERMTKKHLAKVLTQFFGKEMTLENGTDADFKDIDYSFIATTGNSTSTRGFIDIEIYYLKMRNKAVLITGTEILDYVD